MVMALNTFQCNIKSYDHNKKLNNVLYTKGPDHLWSVRSSLKRYDDIYELILSYEDGESKRKEEQSLKK
jgi:hypothetical protein